MFQSRLCWLFVAYSTVLASTALLFLADILIEPIPVVLKEYSYEVKIGVLTTSFLISNSGEVPYHRSS